MISHVEMITRIVVGTALGGIIGYERDRHGKRAGLRTHLLVATASATFMVVSAHFVYFQGYTEGELVEVDGSRIAASVVSGIGFLAGGVILRTGLTIQGITTAAGLWLVTAIGLCAGAGMLLEAAVVTAMGLVVQTVVRRLEGKSNVLVRKRVSVVLADSKQLDDVEALLDELHVVVFNIDYERRLDEERRISITFDVGFPSALRVGDLIERLERLKDVRRVHVENTH
ncbi:MgtC/SapB family protein [Polyangium jinanense]|uniref:MgtC/SapB family protein n=1 Tax=Polyangium jinanense TaxID=2829994 RepID=A0A9X3X0N1_9BACT|nr:MgtC/SapB family protein [Polyangium jinanense]MDC3952766.1 MgtC/SapB family protein [Polyangium jinanense]MDC3980385.1 MgtC/SapB family protein [Polyangium jinanense]